MRNLWAPARRVVSDMAVTMRRSEPEAAAEKESVAVGRMLMKWPAKTGSLTPMPPTHLLARSGGICELIGEMPMVQPPASNSSPREWFRAWGHFARNCRMTEIIRLQPRISQ